MEKFDKEVAKNLIKKLMKIKKKDYEDYAKTGEKFNSFEIMGVERKEIQICKMIADLINPNGSHDQGKKYLQKFIEIIAPDDELKEKMKEEFENQSEEKIKVFTEYGLNSGRRIDIIIKTENIFIPFEVKIDAKDEKSQCYDYYQFASKRNQNALEGCCKLYYLTLDGLEPSEESLKKEGSNCLDVKKELKCISFKEHIIDWLNECIKIAEKDKLPSIYYTLKQFKTTIENITGNRMLKKTIWIN